MAQLWLQGMPALVSGDAFSCSLVLRQSENCSKRWLRNAWHGWPKKKEWNSRKLHAGTENWGHSSWMCQQAIAPVCIFMLFYHFRLINIVFSHSPKLIKNAGSRLWDWIPLFREDAPQRQWKHSRPQDTSFKVPLCSVTISETWKGSSVTMFMESLPFQLKLPTGKATNSGSLECKQ